MSDQHDSDTTISTLQLPARLAARLQSLRKQLGEELVIDLLRKAHATIEARLALRVGLYDSTTEKEPR
jgi:hypothetical protein